MPSGLPQGEPAPSDGSLPDQVRPEIPLRPLGIYVHVPFCPTRCGYCDFNPYTPPDLGGDRGASRTGYIDAAIHELRLAARVLGPDAPAVSTIFVGGGTPTVLPPDDLGRLITAVRTHFGLAEDAEVTTESNPESIDSAGLQRLCELGFNRSPSVCSPLCHTCSQRLTAHTHLAVPCRPLSRRRQRDSP